LFHEELLQGTIRYTHKWDTHFSKNLKYKQPYIVNGYEMKDWFFEELEKHEKKH